MRIVTDGYRYLGIVGVLVVEIIEMERVDL